MYGGLLHAQSVEKSGWYIPASEIDPNNYYGVTLANGMVGLVSSPNPMQIKDVVLNGVYDNYQRGRVSNILKTFSHMNVSMSINGQGVSIGSASNYKQVLDMKRAQLISSFDIGKDATVKQSLMSLRNLPYTAMSVVEITAKKDVEIIASNAIVAPDHLSDIRNYYSQIDRPHVLISLLSSEASSPGGIKVATSTAFVFPEAHGQEPNVIHEEWDYSRHTAKFMKKIKAGQTYRFAVVGSTLAEVHNKDPRNEAERLSIYAKLEGIDRMMAAHQKAWAELWKSDIIVEGDLGSQRAIRSAVYHLYSFARKGSNLSLSPMDLSGLGYNGHVFWDTELWMYPSLLVLQPEIAKSLLEYRFERLAAAKENAFAHGFDGAMFPWESADDGSEETPVWALTGPFQQHISATIGWAFWKYYEVTGDLEWLETRGYPVLLEVARFWKSRVEDTGNGRYEIKNVIGANEFEENIDNNAFTNGMVKTVLEYATLAAEALGKSPDPDWRRVAARIPIVKFPDGTTKENETYAGQEIKQVDATLLSYPLKVITDPAEIKRDLEYYHPRLAPSGPAMGVAISATLYARLGDAEKAYNLFQKSYKPNEVPPFAVLAETVGGTNPYFATGAGGMLQSILFGFGGLDISPKGVIQTNVTLPKNWKSLKLTGIGVNEESFK
ncbi:glycosyl hydrolase family 95 catalytic domain-containing protein [Reichenbachiella sp.]|uniref:glycosyl hydrolase family 95 catalytic domain-containing protein n=1 Tax=Reichenbachiella sp. TaxID=2184521 RepID=UPI003B5ADD67